VSYLPLGDADSDGVLNFKDAFPEDPARSADADFDGIDDTEDSTSDRYIFDHTQFIAPNAIEHVTPSMRPTSTSTTTSTTSTPATSTTTSE
jgi:hypothetical protein